MPKHAPGRRLGGERLEPRRLLAAGGRGVEPAWFAAAAATEAIEPSAMRLAASRDSREWIIQLSDAAVVTMPDPAAAAAVLEAAVPGLRVLRGLGGRGQLLAVAEGDRSAALEALPEIVRLEANGLVATAAFEPNDPEYLTGKTWGLENDGQAGGLVDADIDAAAAWEISAGDPGVVIAVIDGGIDISHPDLIPNAWRNSGEIAGNGVDDDGNGFVDDVYGWDFRNGNGSVFDVGDNDHGTLVAGVAAARGGNGSGGLGVAPLARLLPLKFIGSDGGSTADAIAALNYVTMMRQRGVGIRVANLSWGSSDSSWFLKRAIEDAGAAGVLVVASAGNEGRDQDAALSPNYPSGFDSDTILAVAATDRSDRLWAGSNYGLTRVDLAAPGVSILGPVPGRGFDFRSGTSFAAAFVSGVAALAAAAEPSLSAAGLRQAILDGIDPLPSLTGRTASGGRLNAAATLRLVSPPDDPEREYLESASGELLVVSEPRVDSRQLVIRGAGTVVLAGANQHSGGTRVESGRLVIRDPAALGSGLLEVYPGAVVELDIGGETAAVADVRLGGGRIELGFGGLAIANGSSGAVREAVLAGRGSGSWTGPAGITSAEVAAAAGTLAIGYAASDDGSTLVMATAIGDLDLDRDVDLFDLLKIAAGDRLNADQPAGWEDGDVDYDGRVTIFDLQAISGSGLFAAGSIRPAGQPPGDGPRADGEVTGLDPRQQAFARLAMGISWELVALPADDEEHGAGEPLLQ